MQIHPLLPTIAWLSGITLLGLAVRLYGLTSYGMWFDEAYHVQLVRLPTVGAMLEAVLSNPPSDPLYVLVLRGWTAFFDTGDASIRIPSVIFGTATIPATYWLGRLVAGRPAGILGALFFAISPYAVEFGQEAALYGLAAMLTTLALAGAWRWLKSGSGMWSYVLLGVLAIYSHYVVAVILFLVMAFLLPPFHRIGARGKWLFANGLVLLAWLPWLVALIIFWLNSALPRAALHHAATLQEVIGALVQFTSGTASLQQGVYPLWILGLLGGALLLGGGLFAARRTARWGVYPLLLISGLIFIAPAITSALTGRWLFVPHFMLFLLPTIFVCLASSIYIAVERRTPFLRAIVVGIALIWVGAQVWGLALYYRYPPHGADGLRELAGLLARQVQPEDKVFVTPPALTPTLQQYFSGNQIGLPEDFDLRRVYIPYNAEDWHARSLARIDEQLSAERIERIWLIYRPELDKGGWLLNELQERYSGIMQHAEEYATLYLFDTRQDERNSR